MADITEEVNDSLTADKLPAHRALKFLFGIITPQLFHTKYKQLFNIKELLDKLF